ncbi:MAG: TatD family hydrolase [Candidatus Wildermuthbacteria bacterium]|nr:TatD family hydrolase [Candidatus Wildermuthbacteria bacterium]
MPFLIDTHGHVNFNAFRNDADDVLGRALKNDTWVIMPGSQYSTSQRAVEIAERFKNGVFAAVGIHPIHLEHREVDVMEVQSAKGEKESWMTFETRAEEFDHEAYKDLAKSKKVVAIGEVGLDYYYEPKGKAKREEFRARQKETLEKQISLALELNLPVILHCRAAHPDLFNLLTTRYPLPTSDFRGVLHCYTGNLEQAKKFLDLGLYFGFNGLIFKKVPALPDPREIISFLPLDRILLETDSPYLVPSQAAVERNEPLFVKYVAQEISRIKNIPLEKVAEITTQNALTLFHLSF